MSDAAPRSPLELLQALATEDVEIAPDVHHLEIYTLRGLLTLLWHGDPQVRDVVVMGGGGMGGLLGPAGGLYHDLAQTFAADGIGTIRVGYRRPNDLPSCVLDVAAAADLATRTGGERFVTVGHSFGGAVALQVGIILGAHSAGVALLSTQSAGCEDGAALGATPLLLLHGDRDEILPPDTSAVVQSLVGHGDLVILPGAGHLLTEAHDELRDRLGSWIPACFAAMDDPAR